MSDTSKSSESRSKNRGGGGWNPFRRMISIVTGGGQSTESETSESSDGEKIVLRWTAACINTTSPIFAKQPQFNMIYCPAPSLLMFVVVLLSSENDATTLLNRLFEITDDEMDAIRETFTRLNTLRSADAFYCFVRFLVDEERTTTVSKELMAKSSEVGSQQVFASIRPSRVVRFLNSLTFRPVTLSRPSLLTTNGFGSAGVVGRWTGRTRKAGMHRFACTYNRKKMERFFEIRTNYRRVLMEQFEVVEVPFHVGTSSSPSSSSTSSESPQGSVLFLRPHFLGHLPYANRQLTGDALSTMLQELSSTAWAHGRLLLPQFAARGCHDLWKNLMRHGVQPDLGQSHKTPPMASLWHWASLTVGSDGIGGMTVEDPTTRSKNAQKKKKKTPRKVTTSQMALEQVVRGRVPGESLYEKHKTYSIRIDSSFTYLLLINGIPIFAGSYFGNPPPKTSDLFVMAPERIRHRRANTKTRRRKPKNTKETRKQKLWRKIRKSEEREKEKDRRRAEREAKLVQKAKLKNKKNAKKVHEVQKTESTSSTSSEASTTSSERSPSESAVQKREEPPKEPKEPKSKSSGWRRFADRLFRRN